MPRYIDADKLKSLFLENYTVLTDIIREQNTNSAIIGVSELIGNIIKDTPTADVQEVKHGKWIQFGTMRRADGKIYDYFCSWCKGPAGKDDYNNYATLSAYCPHCGAKMDGK